ncbi:MAG: antibiotic biosynthesis monooxygenase family protein [Gemmatimonadota bacterium]
MKNFIRNVTFQIKPGQTAEFTRLFTDEILPAMKKQPGFRHDLAMTNPHSVVNLSMWQDQPSAEKWHTTAYPDAVKKLASVIEGTPRVESYELAATTLTV